MLLASVQFALVWAGHVLLVNADFYSLLGFNLQKNRTWRPSDLSPMSKHEVLKICGVVQVVEQQLIDRHN